MVSTIHVSKLRHRHVTGNALDFFAVGSVMCVCLSIFHSLFVARHASVISFGGIPKAIAATRCMAMHTVQLDALDAWAHAPARHGIILTQITPIRIEIRILQCDQIIMIEILVPRRKGGADRTHLGVTAITHRISLFDREWLCADKH